MNIAALNFKGVQNGGADYTRRAEAGDAAQRRLPEPAAVPQLQRADRRQHQLAAERHVGHAVYRGIAGVREHHGSGCGRAGDQPGRDGQLGGGLGPDADAVLPGRLRVAGDHPAAADRQWRQLAAGARDGEHRHQPGLRARAGAAVPVPGRRGGEGGQRVLEHQRSGQQRLDVQPGAVPRVSGSRPRRSSTAGITRPTRARGSTTAATRCPGLRMRTRSRNRRLGCSSSCRSRTRSTTTSIRRQSWEHRSAWWAIRRAPWPPAGC